MIELRDYQIDASDAIEEDLLRGERPVVSIPTGGGKSLVVADIARKWYNPSSKIVIVVPSRELALQNEDKANLLLQDEGAVGVCCASLNRLEIDRPIIIGTPQSLRARLPYQTLDLVFIDEVQLMPLHEGSHFDVLFKNMKHGSTTPRAGCSATTFRTKEGNVFSDAEGAWFSTQPYEISFAELVKRGWLVPVRDVYPLGPVKMITRGVKKTGGDYNQGALAAANMDLVPAQARVIAKEMETRKRCMIFGITVEHVTNFINELRELGHEAVPITSYEGKGERAENVARFRSGEVKIAATVAAALTGFDVPEIDVVASCRPTMSVIVHWQSIGRGTRMAPGKKDCLNLDFAGNVLPWGPVVDPWMERGGQKKKDISPYRYCLSCGTYNQMTVRRCYHCDRLMVLELPDEKPKLVIVRRPSFLDRIPSAPSEPAKPLPEPEPDGPIDGLGDVDLPAERSSLIRKMSDLGGVSREVPIINFSLREFSSANTSRPMLMVSFNLGGGAIIREWYPAVSAGYPVWINRWQSLQGAMPAPSTLDEAMRRRWELKKPDVALMKRDDAGRWVIDSFAMKPRHLRWSGSR